MLNTLDDYFEDFVPGTSAKSKPKIPQKPKPRNKTNNVLAGKSHNEDSA